MNIKITGRKIDLTDNMKSAVEKKLKKIDKFFANEAEAYVTLSVNKERATAEVTIVQKNRIFRAEKTQTDMYAAIDDAVDIIQRQIIKNKTRLEKEFRTSAFEQFAPEELPEEEKEFKIVKSKRHSVKPMSAEEAILQMNLLGHDFYVFKNDKTEELSIVYRRKDENYGLIEAE